MKKIKWTDTATKKVKATHNPKSKMITKGVNKAAKGGKYC